jgi:predicted HicB family RNase H-like nuclease
MSMAAKTTAKSVPPAARAEDEVADAPQASAKQQFNVYLPPELIRRAKHAAVDHSMSLSRLVELALSGHLDGLDAETAP